MENIENLCKWISIYFNVEMYGNMYRRYRMGDIGAFYILSMITMFEYGQST